MRKTIDWPGVKARLEKALESIQRTAVDPRRQAAVFKERAARYARTDAEVHNRSADVQVLWFMCGGQRLSVRISEIEEMLPMRDCTPVPGAAKELLGVFNYSGDIVPLVDLAAVLEVQTTPVAGSGYVILTHCDGIKVGLKVDTLGKIVALGRGDSSEVGEIASEKTRHFFEAIDRDSTLLLKMDEVRAHHVFAGA